MNEIAVSQTGGAGALMQLIQRMATDDKFDVAKLEALLAVKERWEADEAHKAFEKAMVAFKGKRVAIDRNKHVGFTTSKGPTGYWHATLDSVCEQVGAGLTEVGISHRWETQQLDGGLIRVTCVLTHELGHSTRTSLEAHPDDSGGKNRVQAIGSTVSYLQRYTLMAATGTASRDQDDDGNGGPESEGVQVDPWTPELEAAAAAASKGGHASFKKWWQSQTLEFREAARGTKKCADFIAAAQE